MPTETPHARPRERIGRFEVLSPLGTGADGVVVLARSIGGGERVAVKTIRVAENAALTAIRREIHALRGIDHPGVVRILDDGVEDGLPWLAMEYFEGRTLRHLLDARGPLPPEELLRLASHLARSLAYVHGKGIVHGDLKPENIAFRGDVPVLIDFGFAAQVPGSHAREMLDDRPLLTGTPAYMAPEQILGERIDGRTDLYALGCVLYELATGRPPFHGSDPARILLQQRDESPTPPSQHVAGLPAELDDLVLALLAKDPRQRMGLADDVSRAADALRGAPAAEGRPTSSILYRPSLLGREPTLERLVSHARAARGGRGALVLIEGEAGVGKTYLAAEVARRRGRGVQRILGNAGPGRGVAARAPAEPLAPLRGLLRAAADRCLTEPDTERTAALRAAAAPLAGFEPALRAPEGLEVPRAADREVVLAALRGALDALAREPVLLVLDDLHWADELTLAFLASIAGEWLAERPVLVLATLRSGEPNAALGEVVFAKGVVRIALDGLDAASVATLVGELMALTHVPSPVGAFLARQSAGNPFYVAEYIRAGIAEGLIQRGTDGHLRIGSEGAEATPEAFAALSLPAELRDLVLRRMDRLGEVARALVEIGAVTGRNFEAPLLRRVSGLSDEEFLDAFDELMRSDVIEPVEGECFRFVHDRLSEIVYDRVDPPRRRALHRGVAETLEDGDPGSAAPEQSATLVHHWRAVGDVEREFRHAPTAGLHALSVHAYAAAATALTRSFELEAVRTAGGAAPTPAPEQAHWHQALATVGLRQGDLDRAEREARHGLAALGVGIPRGERGYALLLAREVAGRLLRHVLPWRRRASPSRREELRIAARAAMLLSHCFFFVDEMIAMLAISHLAGDLADRAEHPEDAPTAFVLMGTVASMIGMRSLGERLVEVGRDSALVGRDPFASAMAFMSESIYYASLGDWEPAERAAKRGVDASAQQGDPHLRDLALVTLGHIEHFTGRVEEGLARFRELLRRATERDNPQLVTWAHFTIGRGLVALGRDREALPHLDEAWSRLEARPETQSEVICAGLQALARQRLGERERALDHAEHALARIGRGRPTAFVALPGYEGMIEVFLRESEAGNPRALRQLGGALRAWRRLGRIMPVAGAASLRHRAAAVRLRGRERRALDLLERAAALAGRGAPAGEQERIAQMRGIDPAHALTPASSGRPAQSEEAGGG